MNPTTKTGKRYRLMRVGLAVMLTFGGLGFLNRGGDDIESFVMAGGFILAFLAYGATMYTTKDMQGGKQ